MPKHDNNQAVVLPSQKDLDEVSLQILTLFDRIEEMQGMRHEIQTMIDYINQLEATHRLTSEQAQMERSQCLLNLRTIEKLVADAQGIVDRTMPAVARMKGTDSQPVRQ